MQKCSKKSQTRKTTAALFDKVTTYVHHMDMIKVGIAKLKAQLSAQLRKVRRGHSLIVLDRDTPIARIVPYEEDTSLEIRRATRKPRDLRLPPPPRSPTDSLTVLLEDRASR